MDHDGAGANNAILVCCEQVRIVPLYWFTTLLLYGGWLIFRDSAQWPPVSGLLQSLFFVPFISGACIGGGRFVRWGLPAFLVVVGALSLEPLLKEWRLPMLLGNASYSIYITYSVVLSTFKSAVLVATKTLSRC